jgi:hypothetical protein
MSAIGGKADIILRKADIRVEPARALDLFQRLIVTRTVFLRVLWAGEWKYGA